MFDVVIPLYDKEQFVEATLQSVIAQTYRDWRLFVVDDGSSDRGPGVVESFKDPRISFLRQANQGVGPARNAGIRRGSSEWIAFLDADDVWDEDHLEELDAVRREFPEAVLIGCAFRRLHGLAASAARNRRAGRRRLARYFAESARGRQPFITSSSAVRRSAITEMGAFAPLPGNEDVELWARLALGGPVAVSERVTVGYRIDTGGITDRAMADSMPAARPMRRQEMSSTIPTLTERLPQIADRQLREDVSAYMDARVGLALVRAVRSGDLDYARHVLSLYEGRPRGKAMIAARLIKLPKWLARLCVTAGLLFKRVQGRRA